MPVKKGINDSQANSETTDNIGIDTDVQTDRKDSVKPEDKNEKRKDQSEPLYDEEKEELSDKEGWTV